MCYSIVELRFASETPFLQSVLMTIVGERSCACLAQLSAEVGDHGEISSVFFSAEVFALFFFLISR